MLSIIRVKVVGFKRWKGELEGKQIDSGKLFCEVQLDAGRNSASSYAGGVCTEEIKLPNGEFCKLLEHAALPCTVELQMQRVSNGKASRDEVVKAELIEQAQQTPIKAVKAA